MSRYQDAREISEQAIYADVFGRHVKSDRVHTALGILGRLGLIVTRTIKRPGSDRVRCRVA